MVATRIAAPSGAVKSRASKATPRPGTASKATPAKPPRRPQDAPAAGKAAPAKPPPPEVLAVILGAVVALARLILGWATPEGERLRAAAAALALACPAVEPATDRASTIAAAGERLDREHEAHGYPLGSTASTPRPLTASELADLRVQVNDITSAALDATRPLGRRLLGRRAARRLILDAHRKASQLFTLAGEARHASA